MTRPESGSQLIPYHCLQQSVFSDQVLKIPRLGSLSEDLKALRAVRSEGEQHWTTEKTDRKTTASNEVNGDANNFFIFKNKYLIVMKEVVLCEYLGYIEMSEARNERHCMCMVSWACACYYYCSIYIIFANVFLCHLFTVLKRRIMCVCQCLL